MIAKLNLQKIFKRHLETLKETNSNHYSKWDIFILLISPLLASVILVLVGGFSLDPSTLNLFATIYSIFAAILMTFLVIVYEISAKTKDLLEDCRCSSNHNPTLENDLQNKLTILRKVHANVAFTVCISIFALIIIIISLIKLPNVHKFCTSELVHQIKYIGEIIKFHNNIHDYFKHLLDIISCSFIGIFCLHLIMILKRISLLLFKESEI